MASKRLKKKKERQQCKKSEELIVNFTQMISEPSCSTPDIQVNLTTTKKESSAMKMNFCIQYQGKEYKEQDIVDKIKQQWKNEGNKIGDMKTLDIYLKVEEGKAYYVVNGEISKELQL